MNSESFLRENKIKVTKARCYLLTILQQEKKSITAEKIYEKFKKENISVNLSTIYRSLELFEEKEIVEKYPQSDGVIAYKIKRKNHKHLLRCTICHKEIEVECPMRQIEEMVQDETGFTLTEHNLTMNGICKECSRRKK